MKCAMVAALAVLGSGVLSAELPAGAAPPPDQLREGARVFNRCRVCHSLDEGGPHGFGPNLYGLFGRRAGSRTAFDYSPAMETADIVWTAETLDDFLAEPDAVIPGNRMSTAGIVKKSQRDALIAYLLTMTRDAPTPAGEKQ